MEPNFLLINKPAGWTSFDAVNFIRKKMRAATGTKTIKVGHAGTLDPFATGLLIIGIGREATKKLDEFKNLPKTYNATIELGATSDTQDSTGTITRHAVTAEPAREQLEHVLKQFIGKQEQLPPMHSAKQVGGVRLYKLARQGKVIDRQTTPIEIYALKLLSYTYPLATIEVQCSTGTYIRTLAQDIGEKLGTGAYCHSLERTMIGQYQLAKALAPKQITPSVIDNFN